jgi:hypothetical protein
MYADSDSARSLNGTGEVRSRHMYMKFHIQCRWSVAFEAHVYEISYTIALKWCVRGT